MSVDTIENRVSVLETEVARLKNLVVPSNGKNWLDRIDGSFMDEPAFDDVIRFGREIRQSDRPPENNGRD